MSLNAETKAKKYQASYGAF